MEIKEIHEKGFIHINWHSILRLFAFLGSLSLSVLNFILIISTWQMLNLGNLNIEDITGFNQLLILYPLIAEYVLIGLSSICLNALIKGGFDKLKSYNEVGLIRGLIGGLIKGLIVGLIAGMIAGLIAGLIGGLIGGLTGGLIVGLIRGMIEEFN